MPKGCISALTESLSEHLSGSEYPITEIGKIADTIHEWLQQLLCKWTYADHFAYYLYEQGFQKNSQEFDKEWEKAMLPFHLTRSLEPELSPDSYDGPRDSALLHYKHYSEDTKEKGIDQFEILFEHLVRFTACMQSVLTVLNDRKAQNLSGVKDAMETVLQVKIRKC